MRQVGRIAAVGAVALLLAACGDDAESSGEEVTGDAVSDRPCVPVGSELEAEAVATVEVGLDEYTFDPTALEAPTGVVTFETTNNGDEPHELAFLPGGGEVPLTADGAPDEDALADAGAFELEGYGPGGSCNGTFELEAGTYTVFCIVEADDGSTHLSKGMEAQLLVQ